MKFLLVLLVSLSWIYSTSAVAIYPNMVAAKLIQQQSKIFSRYKKLNSVHPLGLLFRFDYRAPSEILVEGF